MEDDPDRLTTNEQLRSIFGDPSLSSQQKFMDTLDERCQAMVRLSLLFLAFDNPAKATASDDVPVAALVRVQTVC